MEMAFRTKLDSNSKRLLKEKIVQIYERFFQGEDLLRENPNFWEELFLLKPNISHLQAEVQKLNEGQIIVLKSRLNQFFAECVKTLKHNHHIRIFYSLQTLCTLVYCMYKKCHNDCGFDLIDILIGFNDAEKRMRQLLYYCNQFLTGEWPCSLKSICLKLLLIIATGTDNVSQNTLLEYLMMDNIFESLAQLLCDAISRQQFGHDVITLLTLLLNYRKYEATNPYVVKLSILDEELSLSGYGLVIANTIADFCRRYTLKLEESQSPQSIKWFLSLTHIVGNMFLTDEDNLPFHRIGANSGVLLALYEIVHLNRNFVSILAQTQTEMNSKFSLNNKIDEFHRVNNIDGAISEPLNLFIIILQYCSIIMQNTKYEEGNSNVKLCFIIITCITEDQYANSLLHDFHLTFKVQLFRMPMRHRQIVQNKSQTLAATLLDLLTEFMMSHMMKKLPVQLYQQCVGIIHRLLCYQKKCIVRMDYNWKILWEALITLLKFLLISDNRVPKKADIFNLALQIINIFNLFITYGDTILASPRSYDLLYYEIIRMRVVFENVYSLALKYSCVESECRDVINRIINGLINVRSIINHFSPKVEKWITENSSSLSEDQVLRILRKNYDSLTLKLLDNLDQYERYSEKPQHTAFFSSLVRNIATDTRKRIDYSSCNVQAILREFSSVSCDV